MASAFFMPDDGRRFIIDALSAVGVPQGDAQTIADLMILTDRRGIDTHGIARLPVSINRLKSGAINPTPKVRILEEAPSTALVDGDNGMGQVVMSFAAKLAIEKAKTNGIGWVGTRMSNHAGAAALYAMMPLAHDMIGMYLAVAEINHMAPWGGFEALLGTNPIAVAIPTMDEPPIVHDIATTVASNGRISAAAESGTPLPEGWVIGKDGKPITDSKRAGEGTLLPMGDYKGYGLGLVFALMGGALNGTPVGRDAGTGNRAPPSNTGQAIMALDISKFGPPEQFKRYNDKVVREMRESKPLPGVERVRYPGEGGHAKYVASAKGGIALRPAVHTQLDKIAETLKIEKLTLKQ